MNAPSSDRSPDQPPERLVTGKRAEEDAAELALRPQTLDDFIGQKQVRENLKIFIAAAKARGEALELWELRLSAGITNAVLE